MYENHKSLGRNADTHGLPKIFHRNRIKGPNDIQFWGGRCSVIMRKNKNILGCQFNFI